ncbi:MAG TPA: crossover junction endodeoxyribonuclease RuvC [Balneolales bacterium]|nr:crossover junction endodeoxyribonuclease RuvC [Balneolales bacterium]
MQRIILGIDPGSRTTGYSILINENGKLTALRCDVLRMAKLDNHADRLQYIFEHLGNIVRSFHPTECAIETPVYGKDPQAMLKLGRAQAACILAATTNDIPVIEYYPKAVKKSITGNGNASKKQVAFMLRKMVTLEEEKLPNDATDALAVAWCHMVKQSAFDSGIPKSQKKHHQNRKGSSWEEFVKNNPDRVR